MIARNLNTLALNLNAEDDAVAQIAQLPALKCTRARIMGLWQDPLRIAATVSALEAHGVEALHCLGFADPSKPDEHRLVAGKDAKAWGERAALYASLSRAREVEVYNEPNKAGFMKGGSPAVYAALCLEAVPRLLAAGVERVWVGSLAQTDDAADYAKALKAAGLFRDPRVGLSFHAYRPGAQIGVALHLERERYRAVLGNVPYLGTEVGFRNHEAPVVWSAPDLVPDHGRNWTPQGETSIVLERTIAPRGGRAFYEAKGVLTPGYHRVSVSIRAKDWCVVKVGTTEDETFEVLAGPQKRRVSVVVKANAIPKERARIFSVIGDRTLYCGTASCEPVPIGDEEYARLRMEARERETRGAWQTAIDLGLYGAFVYALHDGAGGSYGVATEGVAKVSASLL